MIRHSVLAAVLSIVALCANGAEAPPSPLVVLSQQAPNATAWVLAPLDRAVPEDIRQNLTFLREDLLDEGKANAKAGVEAYRSAHQLCSSMIAALDERDKALARAGVLLAHANANVAITNQALEARRSYLTGWTQYAREGDQREELKSQAASKVALANERYKAEWTARVTQLRTPLDTLYAQFRDELRKEPALLRAATEVATASPNPAKPPTPPGAAPTTPSAASENASVSSAKELTHFLSGTAWTWTGAGANGKDHISFDNAGACKIGRYKPHAWTAKDSRTIQWEDGGATMTFNKDLTGYEATTSSGPRSGTRVVNQ